MKCDGCDQEIEEGEHHLEIDVVRLATLMPPGFVPARDMEPTEFRDLRFHNPYCHLRWYANNPIVADVFGR